MPSWVKLYRKLMKSDLWLAEPFSRGQAWVDLLMLARFQDGLERVRGVRVDVKRGQVSKSEVELAKRWKWSRGKVRRFLNELKMVHQIEQQKTNVTSLITIINYENYQVGGTANSTASSTANGTANGTAEISQATSGAVSQTPKNDKKEKNEREEEETLYSASNFSSSNGIPVKEISETWNDYIEKNCSVLPQIARINKKSQRYRHIHARWKEYPDLETWQTVLNKATKSDFLNGRVKKFQASFDWVVKSTDNFSKVLEGNYDNKGGSASGMTLEEFKEEFNMEIKTREELEEYIQKGNIRSDQRRRFKE